MLNAERKNMSKTKYCPNCYLNVSVKEFNFSSRTKDNLQSYCRTCSHKVFKKHRDNNPKYKERERAYEKIRQEKMANGEMPHRVEATKIRQKNNSIIKRIVKNVEAMLDKTFINSFGCSKQTFVKRFEKEFEKNPGMTWKNYGAWHMDHIKPLGSFLLDTKANRKLANLYTNLRPIWATVNMKKGSKYMENRI